MSQEIKFDKKNYRKHNDRNKILISKSLKECGAGRSIVIDNEGEIIAGNGIYEQAKKLKIPTKIIETDGSELVVVKRTDLNTDDEKRKQLAIMDNSTSDSSDFDFDSLQADFDVEQLQDWGLDFEFESLEEQEIIEDEVPEEVETKCKLGDIWQLGNHRLMCGDSTSITDVEKLMDGVKADMVFTDPPYGINIVGKNGKVGAGNLAKNRIYSQIIGDDTTETAQKFYAACIGIGMDKFIIFGGNYFTNFLPFSDSWIIWDKRGDMSSNNFADGEMAWCSFHTPVRIYKQIWNGMIREGESGKRCHPTQKPITLLTNILRDFTKENNSIFDGFGGSGSTLIACEQLDRRCYMMELDPHYCDVIIQRWENFINKRAVLLNGEQ